MVTVFGLSFVAIRVGLDEIPPFMLAALRFTLAALPAVFLVRRPAMPWTGVVAYGLAIGVFQFGLLFLGIALGMPAGLSSLVIQVQVFFTIALAVAFAGDRFRRWNALGAIVAAGGIVVLGGYKLASGASGTLAGFVAILGAALAWAAGNLIAKRAGADHDVDAFSLVVWSSLVPPLPLAVASYAFEGGPAAAHAVAGASWVAWACVAFMAWAATLFSYGAWNRLLHTYPTPLIAPFALLIPVAGLGSAALFLGERLALPQAAGVALVFAGLAVNVLGPLATRRASG
ncbi:putative amino-acid metabolite efflux pump [Burkholderiales bacterium]|nr:putative amino-acid metabolite efflux pump [Burkholderiales bacterium]